MLVMLVIAMAGVVCPTAGVIASIWITVVVPISRVAVAISRVAIAAITVSGITEADPDSSYPN
jgi:hypothetical protein